MFPLADTSSARLWSDMGSHGHALRRVVGTALLSALVAVLAFASVASAKTRVVEPADLSKAEAETRVIDRVFTAPLGQARAAGARVETFASATTPYRVTISTDLPGVDLAPYAAVLLATIHGPEIEELRVEATTLAGIQVICGDERAVACYGADNPDRSRGGQMWFAVDDPEWQHTLVHEYGHHVDNQLLNLAHLGACGYDNDGSRNWFFTRDVEDDILNSGFGCSNEQEWEQLVGELYAEDFVVLNGFNRWVLPSAPPPTPTQLDALADDIAYPFTPARGVWRTRLKKRQLRVRELRLRDHTFLSVAVTAPRGSDFDLYLYRGKNAKRRFWKSQRRGPKERIELPGVLAPGVYYVGVAAVRGRGTARVSVALE